MGPAHQRLVTRVGGLENGARLLNSEAVRSSMRSQLSSDARRASDIPADPFCSATDPHGATSLQRRQGSCRRRAVLVRMCGGRGCCGWAERVGQQQGGSSSSTLFCAIFGCGCVSRPPPCRSLPHFRFVGLPLVSGTRLRQHPPVVRLLPFGLGLARACRAAQR